MRSEKVSIVKGVEQMSTVLGRHPGVTFVRHF